VTRRRRWTPAIRFYLVRGDHGFLSNLYRCQVEVDGIVFGSAEHAYQFGKPKHPVVCEWIRAAPLPRLAATAGHHLSVYDIVPDWEAAKVPRMRRVVEAKFRQNADLRERLLATGEAELVEESRDGFWGEGQFGNGQNMLGSILREVRDRLRAEVA
jgi:N-glycosidase YbiA